MHEPCVGARARLDIKLSWLTPARRWEAGWGLEPSLTCLPGSLRELSLIAVRQGKFSVRRSIWVQLISAYNWLDPEPRSSSLQPAPLRYARPDLARLQTLYLQLTHPPGNASLLMLPPRMQSGGICMVGVPAVLSYVRHVTQVRDSSLAP